MPCRLLALPLMWVLLVSRVPPAALPPDPIVEDVPLGPVEVPPTPSVDADVPPTAALPPEPPVALELVGFFDEPLLPSVDALCATATEAMPAVKAPASRSDLRCTVMSLVLLFTGVDVDDAVAVGRGDR